MHWSRYDTGRRALARGTYWTDFSRRTKHRTCYLFVKATSPLRVVADKRRGCFLTENPSFTMKAALSAQRSIEEDITSARISFCLILALRTADRQPMAHLRDMPETSLRIERLQVIFTARGIVEMYAMALDRTRLGRARCGFGMR